MKHQESQEAIDQAKVLYKRLKSLSVPDGAMRRIIRRLVRAGVDVGKL